jgi:exonuclease III
MCKKTSKKIFSITREKDDVVFLCDTRLNSDKQISAINDIKKRFAFRGYDLFFNSKTNSRGVGILISKKLSYVIHNEYADVVGNIYLLNITINNKCMTIGSVYGPNQDDELFFNNVGTAIRSFGNENVIIGGDWNTTPNGTSSIANLDILNMASVPSRRRSRWLSNLYNDSNLSEPYRFFYPERREYTYIPNAVANLNRSRLDFFLIGTNLLTKCKNCTIGHHLDSLLFDHKSVRLSFRNSNPAKKQIINDSILSDIDLESSVKCYVFDHYVNHATVCDDFPNDTREHIQVQLGNILNNIRLTTLAKTNIAKGISIDENTRLVAGYRTEIDTLFERLPRFDYFEN